MIIKKISMFDGKEYEMDLNVTQAQIDAWRGGQLIQRAMPHLTAGEREFLISGVTPGEWDKNMREDEEDEFYDYEEYIYEGDARP